MNGQMPTEKKWPEIVEEFNILIHNSEIHLELLKAQLKEAIAHIRGK